MNHYTYIDYSKNREVVFECDATDIIEADKLILRQQLVKIQQSKITLAAQLR